MTHIEKQHLEVIEEETLGSWTAANGNDVRVCYANDLAKSCALITQRHGEIQRLEGMIEGFRLGFHPQCSDKYDDVIDRLENQLKELKG